jgi:hypothetical protein
LQWWQSLSAKFKVGDTKEQIHLKEKTGDLAFPGFYHFSDKHFLTMLAHLVLGDAVVATALFLCFFSAFFFCFSVFLGFLSPMIKHLLYINL